ncbi:MAG: ATP-binding cassette domain-containing protein [Desulfobacterales bacterium]
MISIENLDKSYGGQVLFDGISFKVNPKERIGLVGRNGHGKTTLFRIITGEESADNGKVIIPKNYRLGYVQQHISFIEDTVLKEGMRGLPEAESGHYWKVEKILSGLGFSPSDMQRSPHEFSGGFQVRLNLAKVLVSEPDMLLLDEPTNYLDIASIRWIERFLLTWPHELMLITHDRSFMDKIATHIVGIHRKKSRKFEGNTEKYYTQIAQEEEIVEKTRLNEERREKEIELFISRFRAKARLANMVQSRIKTLSKMEKTDKLQSIKTLDFSFRSKPFTAKYVMSAQNLTFGYHQDKALIDNFNITISSGERICVVGKNGKGKTTLLRLLAGKLKPFSGEIVYNPQVEKGFYEQTNIQSLVDSRTVEEEILYSHDDVDRQAARNICGAMMFEGDSALKKISVLSGGEKSRVMLGKLLVTPVNLLLLDEPTNHLDMESSDALLAAIDSYEGTVVMVTHNEMFLHALADRLIIFTDDGMDIFEGTYSQFLDKGGWHDEDDKTGFRQKSETQQKTSEKLNKKEVRKLRSEIITERSKLLKPLEEKIRKTENDIDTFEKEIEKLNQAMIEASQNRIGGKIGEISRSIHSCQKSIEESFAQLETLTETLENQSAKFQKRLEALDDAEYS